MVTPTFLGIDGNYSANARLTTTIPFKSFVGRMDPDTVDMLVSINGATFTANPDLISFEGDTFTVPNLSAYPQGLQVFQGVNTFEVYSVLTNGTSTPKGRIEVTLVSEEEVPPISYPPAGVWVEQGDRTITINAYAPELDDNFLGCNIYATTVAGGIGVGWYKVNPKLIVPTQTVEVLTPLATSTLNSVLAREQDGSLVSDPTLFRFEGAQTTPTDEVVQVDYREAFEVPESVSQIRTSISVDAVTQRQICTFVHDRQATTTSANPAVPNALYTTIPPTDPLHYVVTNVFLIDGVEVESTFSSEVSAAPITITTQVSTLPQVNRGQITNNIVLDMLRARPALNLNVGAPMRDLFVEPFAAEATKIRFILEFIQAAQSFTTLLAIDDPGNSGSSVPVSQSPYKQALKAAFYLRSDAEVQNLIDNMFDSLAARYGKIRNAGTKARGEVVIWTDSRPTQALNFNIGQEVFGGGQTFRLTSNATITPTNVGAYNPISGKWSTTAFIEAISPGEAGNLGSNGIKGIRSSYPGVKCTNPSRLFGGLRSTTNRQLAVLCESAIASVDAGTAQGYKATAVKTPGVLEAAVIGAGDPFMLRDYQDGGHVGGKVDVWVTRSPNAPLVPVTDTFAFTFQISKAVQFEPIGDLNDLTFRAIHDSLSPDNPIIEMLDFPSYGLKLRNESQGYDFNLDNVSILAFDTIQLDTTLNNAFNLSLTDLVRGSFRYRDSSAFVLTRQPALELTRLQGSRTGAIGSDLYALYRASSPLVLGQSVLAGDYVKLVQSDTSPVSADPIVVSGETHVILSDVEFLNNIGVNPYTVRVFSVDRSVEYTSPYSSVGVADYTIIAGTATTPWGIRRTSTSTIAIGQSVLVDYQHDEAFTVTYTVDSVVSQVQNAYVNKKHATASVLAKSAPVSNFDLSMTVVLNNSRLQSQTDAQIRGALAQYTASLTQGVPVYPSNLTQVVEQVTNVKYVLPFSKLCLSEGVAQIARLERVVAEELFEVATWATGTTKSLFLKRLLPYTPREFGGTESDYVSVLLDNTPLQISRSTPLLNGDNFKFTPYQSFICGTPLAIPGFSDLTTLALQYPLATTTQLLDKQKELTVGGVLLCLPKDLSVNDLWVTYTVGSDTGVRNLEPMRFETLRLGDLQIQYD